MASTQMKSYIIASILIGAVFIAVIGATHTLPNSRAALGYFNGEHQLGIAYGCGMVAENNRLLNLQDLHPFDENAWCVKYRKMWESMSR